MSTNSSINNSLKHKAYIITGPTSGIGRRTALDAAKYGTVVLVGRDRVKLDALQNEIQQKGGNAVSVVCDLSDVSSVKRAAAEIARLNLPLAGLVNNAASCRCAPPRMLAAGICRTPQITLGPSC